MELNTRSCRFLEWLIQNQPELVRDLHNSNKLEERLDERYQRALDLTIQIREEKGISDEEAFEIASDLVTDAERDRPREAQRPADQPPREEGDLPKAPDKEPPPRETGEAGEPESVNHVLPRDRNFTSKSGSLIQSALSFRRV